MKDIAYYYMDHLFTNKAYTTIVNTVTNDYEFWVSLLPHFEQQVRQALHKTKDKRVVLLLAKICANKPRETIELEFIEHITNTTILKAADKLEIN